MAGLTTFTERLKKTIEPTSYQVWLSAVVALIIVILVQSQSLLGAFGITKQGISIYDSDVHHTINPFLANPITAQAALIIFWAAVGLAAYLACWSVYNLMIEARNEVTLQTEYTNKIPTLGFLETLGIKLVSALGLGLMVYTFWPISPIWANLAGIAIEHPGVINILFALVGLVGFAIQLYIVFVFIQLTFTPWYRLESFTDGE
jgi:hypothetical protein